MPKPTNITELRDQILDDIEAARKDPKLLNRLKETSNAAGKVLLSLRLQTEYHFARGEEPDIAFMGETSGRPLKQGAIKMLT